MASHEAILKELIRRGELAVKVEASPIFPIEKVCFDKQLAFIKDPSRFKCAVTSRRAGKTTSCAADLLYTATSIPQSNSLYLTLNRASAKKIIWGELLRLNHKYRLGGVPNQSELTITFPNGSIIYLGGAGDKGQIEKFRGMSLQLIYIDESQAFGSYFQELIEDILAPCLWDTNGSLSLIGTPNASCSGPLYEAAHKFGIYKGYSPHYWTILDNPFIKKKTGKDPQQILEEELARKGITRDDPTFMRESVGKWVKSLDSLVYKYSVERNSYSQVEPNHTWHYVMGIDLGFTSPSAISVLGFHDGSPNVYLIEEWRKAQQNLSELAQVIKHLEQKYEFNKKVVDTGGIGKGISDELSQRYGIYLEPADKTRKYEFIELINDDLRTGKIKVPQNSLLAQEWNLLQWDTNSLKPMEDKRYSNHMADSFLYAWKEAKHFTYQAPIVKPKIGTQAYYEHQEKQLEDELVNRMEKQNSSEWWEEYGASNDDGDDFFR